MICHMVKPKEVLIVKDENGKIVHKTFKDNDVLVQFKVIIVICHEKLREISCSIFSLSLDNVVSRLNRSNRLDVSYVGCYMCLQMCNWIPVQQYPKCPMHVLCEWRLG